MRVKAPPPFEARLIGREGAYHLVFEAVDDWDGVIDVAISGCAMSWNVDNIEMDEFGHILLSGLTRGSENIWNECFWFELAMNDGPVKIDYWGNQVLWRTDYPQLRN